MTARPCRWFAGFTLWLLVLPARGDELQPVRVVPADDTPLASMLLITANGGAPVLLFDPQEPDVLRAYLAQAGRPVECLVRSATPPAARALLESTAGVACTRADDLTALARRLWPQARIAVLASTGNYEWLLRGAALAAASGAALVPVGSDPAAWSPALNAWPLDYAYALPGVASPGRIATHVVRISSPDGAAKVGLRRMGVQPTMVVVANPRDREGLFAPASLSLLAPLVAATHHAPLVLVADAAPDAVEAEVQRFIAAHALAPTHLYLVGDELALRSHRVPDPVVQAGGPEPIGGGHEVRVELFSELQNDRPQDYAVGRFVAESAARASVVLARQLSAGLGTGGQIQILSNADQEFELGEVISHTTVSDLRNAGVKVRARFRDQVTPSAIQEGLAQADILVWEGHARDLTLEERGGVAVDRTPPLVVLQGCYTLDRSDPFVLLDRGTQAVVATSAAIYSASGAAFARALFDGLLYADADLGTAVRNARNYLFAVAELKKRRRHTDWPKTYRAALAFALWGDPSAHPSLGVQTPKLPPAQWQLEGGTLALSIPPRRLKTATSGTFTASPVPRAMLSGLVLHGPDHPEREVKELFYDALTVPADVTAACAPTSEWEVVSLFAPHTRTLSVLARPPGDTPGTGAPAGEFRLPLVSDANRCANPHPSTPPTSKPRPVRG